ncbi:cilia- and flagella-associated protein 69 isoform X1 [Rana temporaria]|uniref:cilia- and flagella-associated protein 69 isoform X1 n=1 Tax=Rana temporaria TaxID=8407 RepID=UPI001AAD05D6|nr:cilia- and flagella-associated protein 69 isoform X1 [Rana temporaria]
MPAAQEVAAAPVLGTPQPDNGRKSLGRPVVRLVVTDTELGEREAVPLKPIDMNRVLKLFEDPFSRDLVERHVRVLKKVARTYCNGIFLKDLQQIMNILNICAARAGDHAVYIDPMCDIVKLCGLPFLKERMSDEAKYAQDVADSFSQLGCLMRVPSSQLRIQICKSIANFYNAEMTKQQADGFQPTSIAYKIQMAEVGGMAETLVLSLTLLENQLQEKIALLKVLQLFSNSIENCKLMAKAQAACRICSRLNDPDPSGQVLFRSSEILWNLLENGPKEEIINQLSNIECIYALKDSFVRLLTNGYRHYDRQLRNDLLVIATLIAENNCSPLVESGFAKQLILFATFPEVKSHNPLVKSLKLLHKHEDFEMKKLLLNMMVVLAKDLSTVQLLSDGKAVLALFNYVKASEKPGIHDWPAARFEDLQLHAIATLSTVAPLLVEDYVTCQGNTRILLFLEWCSSQDGFSGQGNCFHGTGGRGNKHAQMRYSLRLLRAMVSIGDEGVNQDLCDQGAINQLLGLLKKSLADSSGKDNSILLEIQSDILFILSALCENDTHRKELFGSEGVDVLIRLLKMDPSKFYSGLGHNKLLFCTLDSAWSCIIGSFTSEDYFLEKEGLFIILDLLALNLKNMNNLLLGILVEFCDNPKTIPHILTWRGKDNETVPKLLVRLWKQEEEELGVRRDSYGRIVDAERPLVGQFQEEQQVVPMPANCFSVAIMEVAENIRAKIYSVFSRLGFENLPGLSALDYVTLSVISRYLDFKVGEVWSEIRAELDAENIKPVTSDYEALEVIEKSTENISKLVATHQTEMIENHQQMNLQEEQQKFAEIKANHKQSEIVMKTWDKFLTRTSNYEALKKAKRLQEKSIESSRPKARPQNSTIHSTQIANLNTTVAGGRVVTVESTPSKLTGGPLADTDLALKRVPIRGGALQKTQSVKLLK